MVVRGASLPGGCTLDYCRSSTREEHWAEFMHLIRKQASLEKQGHRKLQPVGCIPLGV